MDEKGSRIDAQPVYLVRRRASDVEWQEASERRYHAAIAAGWETKVLYTCALIQKMEEWVAEGERLSDRTGMCAMFSLGAWWADRPWRR